MAIALGLFAATLMLFDNAIFAESHFGLIDIFVPFFGFIALLCYPSSWRAIMKPCCILVPYSYSSQTSCGSAPGFNSRAW